MRRIALTLLLVAAAAGAQAQSKAGSVYGALDVGTWSGSTGSPTAFTISGGYRILPNLAAEVGYTKLSDVSYGMPFFGTFTLSQSVIKGAAVYTHPVAPNVNVLGRAGLSQYSSTLTGGGMTQTSSGTYLTFGGGAEYVFNKQFSARAMLETVTSGTTLLTVGGVINF